MTKLAFFDGSYGFLTIANESGDVYEIETTAAHPGHYIKIDDGRQYPQLCEGGGFRGVTLEWARVDDDAVIGREFARDCGARLYKTRAGYDKARAALTSAHDPR